LASARASHILANYFAPLSKALVFFEHCTYWSVYMKMDDIEEVVSQDLGEGFQIVKEDGSLSAVIEWVDWVQLSDDENDIKVEIQFGDDSEQTFEKDIKLKQIWHEHV
jgi:hypothetical protein